MTHSYVSALESRVADLESLLMDLKAASQQERNAMIDAVDFPDHLPKKYQ